MPEHIQGFTQFDRKLTELTHLERRGVLTTAAKAGAQIALDAARAGAPRDSGRLADGMTMRVRAGQNDSNEASVDVGPDKKNFYGMFSEFGTRFQLALRWLTNALESNRDRITTVMNDALLRAIERIANAR